MKYLDEFRDPDAARALKKKIEDSASKLPDPVKIMEICGSHTVSIFRSGIKSLLPPNVTMVSGPGCPVCVTAMEDMDRMIALAGPERRENVTIATFGDMVRVPGSFSSLERERAEGADVRVASSPLDALEWARANPDRQVVFLGVGFETTSPTIAATLKRAAEEGLENFSVYPSFKLLPPALTALLESDDIAIDAFLCPGHVSVMLGVDTYRPVAAAYGRPCVIAGFEPLDILLGISKTLELLVDNKHEVFNAYGRAVTDGGNRRAMDLLFQVFHAADVPWRGLGTIPRSGLELSGGYSSFDAMARFNLQNVQTGSDPAECACGQVLRGVMSPPECPLFANGCSPEFPVGSCMVSSEGSCAAWYRYQI